MKRYQLLNCMFMIIFTSISSFSQTSMNGSENYKLFDSIIGAGNNDLYNGTPYKEQFRVLDKNHKYFVSSGYVNGNIIFGKQPYYDIKMKYNIYNDELIVKLPVKSGFIVIQLIKEKVESFSINGHRFINISNTKNGMLLSKSGFYEVLYESNLISFFKKYKKERSEHSDKKVIYYKFKDKNDRLINFKNNYKNIKSKRDLINLFPKQKKKIDAFYNKRRFLRKSNYDTFLTQLMIELDNDMANKIIE